MITHCPFCETKLTSTFLGHEGSPNDFNRYSCENCDATDNFPSFFRFTVFYSAATSELMKMVVIFDNYKLITTYPSCSFDFAKTELYIDDKDTVMKLPLIDIPYDDLDKLRSLVKNIRVFA